MSENRDFLTLEERLAKAEQFADLMYGHGSLLVYNQVLEGVESLKRQIKERDSER